MTISEKVAHLKGIMDGMELDLSTREGKILSAVVDILDDLAMDVADIQDEQEAIADYVDERDYDLGEVEEYLFEDDDDDDELDCDFVEATCPDCGKSFCFEADADPEDVVCPHCGGHFTCVCQCDEDGADCASCVRLNDDEKE